MAFRSSKVSYEAFNQLVYDWAFYQYLSLFSIFLLCCPLGFPIASAVSLSFLPFIAPSICDPFHGAPSAPLPVPCPSLHSLLSLSTSSQALLPSLQVCSPSRIGSPFIVMSRSVSESSTEKRQTHTFSPFSGPRTRDSLVS